MKENYLAFFNPEALERLIVGDKKFNLALLKKFTTFTGCHNQKIKDYFWKYLEESSEEMKHNYLKFVWGRSSLPIDEEAFDNLNHTIYM